MAAVLYSLYLFMLALKANVRCARAISWAVINLFCWHELQFIEIRMAITINSLLNFFFEHYMRDIGDYDNKQLNLSNCPKAKMTAL